MENSNGKGFGGRMQGEDFVPSGFEEALRQQQMEERNTRRRANAEYLRSIGDFGNRISGEMTARKDKQYGAILAAANYALKNSGMTPPSLIDVLGNDLNGPNGTYVGSMFRGTGKDARFDVFLKDANGRLLRGMSLSVADLMRIDNSRGGGSFDDDGYGVMNRQMSGYMTPEQIADATGANRLESIRDRVTGAAGGREIGSVSGPGVARLFGRTGDRRSRISYFSADGNGGFTKGFRDGRTGEESEIDYGARDPNRPGKWSVIESNPDGKRYVNDKTGEEMFVKKGENLRDALMASEVAKAQREHRGRSAEDQIAIDAAKHRNRMDELRIQEEGKTTRSAAKRDFDRKKLDATIKKWGDDLKVRERGAKTAEDKAALEKSRAQYNDFSKRIGVLSNVVNTHGVPKAVKDKARELLAGALDDDGMPNYAAIADEDNQAPIKPGDNSGGKTVTGYRYNKDRTKRIPVYSDGSQGEVEDAK